MLWMVLCVLFGAGFGHTMRHAQVRQCGMAWVGACNYLFAALASWAWLLLQRGPGLTGEAAVLGTLCGLSYVGAYLAMDHALRAAGVGVTQSVQWLGVSLPVAASIFLWHEVPTTIQTAGLVLAFISLPLLASGPSAPDAPRARWRAALLAGLFVLEGLVGLAMKVYSLRVPAGSEVPYLCFMFSGAAAGSIVVALRTARPGRGEMTHGVAMGVANVLCNFTFLRALALLPGTIVFPSVSAGSIALSVVLGALLWHERHGLRAVIGLVLAAVALVAINM